MKPRPVTNLRPIGGAPDPTTAPEVHTGMNKLSTDQGYSQGNQPVEVEVEVRVRDSVSSGTPPEQDVTLVLPLRERERENRYREVPPSSTVLDEQSVLAS